MFCVRLHEEWKRCRITNSFQRNAFVIWNWRKKRAGYANSGVPRSSQRLPGLPVTFSTCLQERIRKHGRAGTKSWLVRMVCLHYFFSRGVCRLVSSSPPAARFPRPSSSGTRAARLSTLLFIDPTEPGIDVSDESLLSQICIGDGDALATLFERYARLTRSVAVAHLEGYSRGRRPCPRLVSLYPTEVRDLRQLQKHGAILDCPDGLPPGTRPAALPEVPGVLRATILSSEWRSSGRKTDHGKRLFRRSRFGP